jgi:hypothetical protein
MRGPMTARDDQPAGAPVRAVLTDTHKGCGACDQHRPKIEQRKRPPTEAASLADSEKLDQNTGQVWMAVQPPSV